MSGERFGFATRQLRASIARTDIVDAPVIVPGLVVGANAAWPKGEGSIMIEIRHQDGVTLSAVLTGQQIDRFAHILANAISGDINAPIGGVERVS